MKYLLLISLFITAFLFLSPSYVKIEDSLLWEISGNDIKSSSYIFGTIKFIPRQEFFFPEIMQSHFEKCNTLVVSVDTDITASERKKLTESMLFPDEKSYKDYLHEELYNDLIEYLINTVEINKDMLNYYLKFKPIYFNSLIVSEKLDFPVTYEDILKRKARKKKMEVLSLETIHESVSMANNINIQQQMPKSKEDLSFYEDYQWFLEIYKKQQLSQIEELINERNGFNEFEIRFMNNHNIRWLPVVEEIISKGDAFILISATHLVGEEGILNLLRKKGYTIKPIY